MNFEFVVLVNGTASYARNRAEAEELVDSVGESISTSIMTVDEFNEFAR